jgi:N-acetylglucosaminyldiphosphoundecaprenol N-acetyl-beta-D-mannosaminyltransferase
VSPSSRVSVLGCGIDPLDREQTIARCDELIRSDGYSQHVAINVAKLVAIRDDPSLQAIVDGCDVVSADGQGVVWASKVLGRPLPERVAGVDLMMDLIALAEEHDYGIYILGAKPDVLERAASVLQERHPRLRIAGRQHGYFADEDEQRVCEDIRASRAHILLVAISSPRKERFLGEHGPTLGVPFAMGVGGSIDIVAGVTRRAPVRWQRLGLEWLYRLLQEPRRMFRRYAVTNARFAWILAGAMVTRGRTA